MITVYISDQYALSAYFAYPKVASASSNTSHLEAHVLRLFQIAYEGDFRSLSTVTFSQRVD